MSPGVGYNYPDTRKLLAVLAAERRHAYGDYSIGRYSQVRYGKLRNDVNHYLKWAYCEAGNSTAVNHKRFPSRHTSKLYKRIRERKGHAKAVGAVGRHLAEASFWVLTRNEDYGHF